MVTPNSDTPYSFLWMDLRTEPLVVTMPKIEKGRYYTGQMVDLYTFNFAYLGTRTYGNDGGTYLVAGPGWNGETPKGIKVVIHCETEFAYILFRTQLFSPADMVNVAAIQKGYTVQPLSKFLGQSAFPSRRSSGLAEAYAGNRKNACSLSLCQFSLAVLSSKPI